MKIFRDVVTNDELFSDTFPIKLIDDMYYEVEGKSVTESTKVDDSMIGGNASAEGGDEGGADGDISASGINVVLSHRLVTTQFAKKDYQIHIKGYMKAVKSYLEKERPDRVDGFVQKMPAVIKKILGDFKNYDFFTGESMNPEGMAVLMNYREDGVTPYFIFFKDGLIEEKC